MGHRPESGAADGPQKHEGDGRSPAGVFRIGTTFGYAAHVDTAMPYRALSATDYCMDVSGTPLYNRTATRRRSARRRSRVPANQCGATCISRATRPTASAS